MTINSKHLLATAMGLFLSVGSAVASETGNSIAEKPDTTDTSRQHESIFDYKSPSLSKSHFTWGADVGASIDVGGYDFSTFDLDVVIGYKNSIIKTLGISAGIHRDFHQGTNFVPLTAVIRTGFIPRSSLCFLNMKAGYSFNTVGETDTKGGFIFNAGVGFNLATSKNFQSHIILSYEFIHLNEQQGTMIDKVRNHVDMIQIAVGVNF